MDMTAYLAPLTMSRIHASKSELALSTPISGSEVVSVASFLSAGLAPLTEKLSGMPLVSYEVSASSGVSQ